MLLVHLDLNLKYRREMQLEYLVQLMGLHRLRIVRLILGVTGSETFYWTPEEAGTYRIKASIQNFDGSATYDDANSDNFEIAEPFEVTGVEIEVNRRDRLIRIRNIDCQELYMVQVKGK